LQVSAAIINNYNLLSFWPFQAPRLQSFISLVWEGNCNANYTHNSHNYRMSEFVPQKEFNVRNLEEKVGGDKI